MITVASYLMGLRVTRFNKRNERSYNEPHSITDAVNFHKLIFKRIWTLSWFPFV
jgi:hypothetical protein